MFKFIKRLFCKHDYEVVNNTMTRWYLGKSGSVIIHCKKCGKTKQINCF